MKLKKILTMLVSLSMMSATFCALSSTASAAALGHNVTATTTYREATDAEVNAATSANKADFAGASFYIVETTVSGLDAKIECKAGRGSAKTYGGTALQTLQVEYQVDDGALYADEYGEGSTESGKNAFGAAFTSLSKQNKVNFVLAAPAKVTDYEPLKTAISTVANASLDGGKVTALLITKKADFKMNVVVAGTIAAITNSAQTDIYTFEDSSSNVTYSPAKEINVKSTPVVSGPSYEITNFYDDPTENGDRGYVWDVTISDFNTTKNSAMANFKVSDDEKVSAEITGLDGIESDGSCNFAVILNTEKTLAATDGFTITFPAK